MTYWTAVRKLTAILQQCARLGHECDYSPKLAFKDETTKVVDKYLGPEGSNEWDRKIISLSGALPLLWCHRSTF